MNQQTLLIVLVLNLALIGTVGYWTYHSGWERRSKNLLYILLLISPVVASFVFLWIQHRQRKRYSDQ